MGIANFSPQASRTPILSLVLAPLQALVAVFMPLYSSGCTGPFRTHSGARAARAALPLEKASWRREYKAPRPLHATRPQPQVSSERLTIVRAFEPGIGPALAGRMVICGRMSDVCAELDRLAEREGAARKL